MVIAYFFGCIIFAARNKFHFDLDRTWNIVVWVAFAIPMIATFIPLLTLKTTSLVRLLNVFHY